MSVEEVRLLQGLDFIWLELTSRCNLSCVHCYAESGPAEPLGEGLDYEDWADILNQASRLGCRRVQFIGGEPTLHPRLADLIRHAAGLGIPKLEVYTNGTHFTPELKEAFIRHDVALSFSVYADGEDVHDEITRSRGSLKRTLSSISWAVESGLTVSAGVIVMKPNAGRVDETIEMLEKMGIARNSIGTDRVRNIGRAAIETGGASPYQELCGRCWKGSLSVSPSGNVYPCVFSRFHPVGKVEEGLENIIKAQELLDFRQKLWSESHAGEAVDQGSCSPEKDPGKCRPEKDPGLCTPEKDPGPCRPEKPSR